MISTPRWTNKNSEPYKIYHKYKAYRALQSSGSGFCVGPIIPAKIVLSVVY
jgi:hypothetical protein